MKIEVLGVEYDCKRLNLGDIIVELQDTVKQELNKEAKKLAEDFGLVGKEKQEFLSNILKNSPKGVDLNIAVAEWLQSLPGHLWTIERTTGKKVDVVPSTIESYKPIVQYAFGIEDVPVEEEEVKEGSEGVAEKN